MPLNVILSLEKAGLLSDDQPMREQTPPRDTSPTYHTMDMENSGEFTHMALSDFSRQEKINISTMDATDNVTLSWRDIKVGQGHKQCHLELEGHKGKSRSRSQTMSP